MRLINHCFKQYPSRSNGPMEKEYGEYAEKRYSAITSSSHARSPSYPLNYPRSNIRNERHESSTLVKHVRGASPWSYVVTRGGKTSPGSWEHRLAGWLVGWVHANGCYPPNTFNRAQHTCFNVFPRLRQAHMTSGFKHVNENATLRCSVTIFETLSILDIHHIIWYTWAKVWWDPSGNIEKFPWKRKRWRKGE